MNVGCGIDIGGSGVKGALVDVLTGDLLTPIVSVETPHPATPDAVIAACAEILTELNVPEHTPVGICFPAPIKRGVIPFMANLDQAWVGLNLNEVMSEHVRQPVFSLNDADAAAIGEAIFGAAAGVKGLVIVTTLGTGIGSGMIYDGKLVPNTELGHLELEGVDAESRASARVKTQENLTWEEFSARLQRYYSHIDMLFSPDLLVVGGGVSENHMKFLPPLKLRTRIVPALLQNKAGFVGGAYYAATHHSA